MTLEELIEFDSRLPMIARDAESELDSLMDVVEGNVKIKDLNEFRKAGVKFGHA